MRINSVFYTGSHSMKSTAGGWVKQWLAASVLAVSGLALLLLGLGFAPIYPCLMHEVPRRFAPEAVLTVIGRQSGASYVGGALFPAAAGWLAMQTSLACVPWLVVAGVGLMALTIHRLNRLT